MCSIEVEEVTGAVVALAAVDLDACDRADLDVVMARWRRVRAFTDAMEVRVARRARQLAEDGRSEPPEAVLVENGRRSVREARAAAARQAACEQVCGFEDALGDGSVSPGHVDALAAAMHGLDDEVRTELAEYAGSLVDRAQRASVEGFARECRELARALAGDEGEAELERQRRHCRLRQWVDKGTGMHHIHAELDAESGAKAWTALNAVTRAMRQADRSARANADGSTPQAWPGEARRGNQVTPSEVGASDGAAQHPARGWDWWAAQALVELLTGARSVDKRVPEVAVHVDWQTLVDGLHGRSLCETSDGTLLPPSTVRRLCCDAEIFPVVLGGDGEVLDLGRANRLANREQRRALRAMYRTCGYPGCSAPFEQCEIHHVEWWERLGRTDLANLLPVCSRHHHLVHEGGWTLRLGPDRVITVIRPDGAVHFMGSTVDRTQPAHRPGAPPGRHRHAARRATRTRPDETSERADAS